MTFLFLLPIQTLEMKEINQDFTFIEKIRRWNKIFFKNYSLVLFSVQMQKILFTHNKLFVSSKVTFSPVKIFLLKNEYFI